MNWSSNDIILLSYRLLNVKGYGCAQANKLLWHLSPSAHSAKQLEDSIRCSLNAQERESFSSNYSLANSRLDVEYLSVLDKSRYPSKLIETLHQNSPTVLSFVGNIKLLEKRSVGICGSRSVSEKGLWIVRDCVSQLAQQDVCIISGYANGVDLTAHKSALEQGATTIIVLPEGISSFYIRSELKEVWDWSRVLVVSEFMPHEKWMASRAMKRNQTIIGLSDAMLVVEAGEKGGSLDAGMKTLSFGKSLFVPYYKEIPQSALGNMVLLNNGANSLKRRKESSRTNLDGLFMAMQQQQLRKSIF